MTLTSFVPLALGLALTVIQPVFGATNLTCSPLQLPGRTKIQHYQLQSYYTSGHNNEDDYYAAHGLVSATYPPIVLKKGAGLAPGTFYLEVCNSTALGLVSQKQPTVSEGEAYSSKTGTYHKTKVLSYLYYARIHDLSSDGRRTTKCLTSEPIGDYPYEATLNFYPCILGKDVPTLQNNATRQLYQVRHTQVFDPPSATKPTSNDTQIVGVYPGDTSAPYDVYLDFATEKSTRRLLIKDSGSFEPPVDDV
ncbi:hypothetical protein OC846_006262, partial [Tilletia horrida]